MASAWDKGGRIPGRQRAMKVFPAPGGPVMMNMGMYIPPLQYIDY